MALYEELKVFSGNSNQPLATRVADYLGIPLGRTDVFKFSNDNTFVRIRENIRQRDVFLIQSFSTPVNDHVMEMLILIDAAKRASASPRSSPTTATAAPTRKTSRACPSPPG